MVEIQMNGNKNLGLLHIQYGESANKSKTKTFRVIKLFVSYAKTLPSPGNRTENLKLVPEIHLMTLRKLPDKTIHDSSNI